MEKYKQEIQKYVKYIGESNFEYSVNISLMNKYIYVETPKVGCSTIKNVLQRMELNYPDLVRDDFEDIHDRHYSPLISPSQTCGFDRLLHDPNFFVFSFARNPYTRLLSAYLDKIKNNRPPKKSILSAMGQSPDNIEKQIPFNEFIDVICNLDIAYMNPHWRIQYYQTMQDSIDYDFVGRMENFQEDYIYVFNKINKNYSDYYSPEIRHATNSHKLLQEYFDDKLTEKVYEKYKIDFTHFGYDKNLPI